MTYDQPFFVPRHLRYRFPTVDRYGYLPAILPKVEGPSEDELVDLRRRLAALEARPAQRIPRAKDTGRTLKLGD